MQVSFTMLLLFMVQQQTCPSNATYMSHVLIIQCASMQEVSTQEFTAIKNDIKWEACQYTCHITSHLSETDQVHKMYSSICATKVYNNNSEMLKCDFTGSAKWSLSWTKNKLLNSCSKHLLGRQMQLKMGTLIGFIHNFRGIYDTTEK